jgi:hypothetical protein
VALPVLKVGLDVGVVIVIVGAVVSSAMPVPVTTRAIASPGR